MESKTWDLVTAQETTNALDVFTSGNIEKIIWQIENEVKSIITDGRCQNIGETHQAKKKRIEKEKLLKEIEQAHVRALVDYQKFLKSCEE